MGLLIGAPPPAGRECQLVCNGGLHEGGEKQGESRAARPAGVHLAGRMNPVGQFTGTDEGRGEDDLPGELAATCSSMLGCMLMPSLLRRPEPAKTVPEDSTA